MTNTNELTAKLKAAAQKATPGIWEMGQENIWYFKDGYTKHLMYLYQGDDVDDRQDHYNTDYIATANPATILALTEALEAAEKRIAELEARTLTVKLPNPVTVGGQGILERTEKVLFEACAAAGIKLQIEGE